MPEGISANRDQAMLIPSSSIERDLSAAPQPTIPARRFDSLPIGINQRPPAHSIRFRGQGDEPGVALYKFLELGDCKRRDPTTGRDAETKDSQYCADLNKPLGRFYDINLIYYNIFHKLEWPGYESDKDLLCDCHGGTTRYQLGKEIAFSWQRYMVDCMELLHPRPDGKWEPCTNPVVDGIEFRRLYLSEFYFDDEREWESKLWVELPDHVTNVDFLRM